MPLLAWAKFVMPKEGTVSSTLKFKEVSKLRHAYSWWAFNCYHGKFDGGFGWQKDRRTLESMKYRASWSSQVSTYRHSLQKTCTAQSAVAAPESSEALQVPRWPTQRASSKAFPPLWSTTQVEQLPQSLISANRDETLPSWVRETSQAWWTPYEGGLNGSTTRAGEQCWHY